MPRRCGGAGMGNHIVQRLLVLGPSLAIAPVFVGQLVALERRALPGLKALELLLLTDRQPELHHDGASGLQLGFEVVDLAIRLLPAVDRGELLDPLDQHPTVIAAVEDRYPSRRGHPAPEAQQVGLVRFFLGRRAGAVYTQVARVETGAYPADGAALAGGIGALVYQQQAAAGKIRPAYQRAQFLLVAGQLLAIFLLAPPQTVIDLLQHGPGRGRQRWRRGAAFGLVAQCA